MKRRFVVGADPLNAAQVKKFQESLGDMGWWHWIENFWLVTANDDEKITAAQIRDRVQEANPEARVVVLEFPEDITWAASGQKNSKGRKLSDWLQGEWANDE